MSVLRVAQIAFDHDVAKAHDQIVAAGAPKILIQCLDRALCVDHHNWHEVDIICQLLCMSYRCSDEVAAESFTATGANLCPLLFSILLAAKSIPSRETPSTVYQLLTRFASLEISLRSMIGVTQLLRVLRQIITSSDVYTERECLAVAMQLIVGLTKHCESKFFFMEYPGLFDSVVSAVSRSCRPACDINLEVARLIENLAWDPRNKSSLAGKKAVVNLIILLARDKNLETQFSAIATLTSLSIDGCGRSKLASIGGKRLLGMLMRAALIIETRERALETLLNLLSHHNAIVLCRFRNFFSLMTSVAASPSIQKGSIIASQIIKRIATYIPASHPCHSALVDSILTLSSSNSHRIRLWAAKSFVAQSLIPGSSFFMMRIHQIVKALAQLAQDSYPAVRASAVEAVQNLAADTANLTRLAMETEVLEVVVRIAEEIEGEEAAVIARRQAVQVLLRLANHPSTKRRIAKQRGLVESLSKFGMSHDSDVELKRAAIHGVILLAPLM